METVSVRRRSRSHPLIESIQACYRADEHHPVALELLTKQVMPNTRVHCVFGEIDDMGYVKVYQPDINYSCINVPAILNSIHPLKLAQVDKDSGRSAASVTWIPKAGHMVS